MSKHSHISAIFDNAFQSRAGSPDVYMSMIHRSKKDGDMSILPECIAGIKKEYVGKDDKKQSYWIEILTQV